MIDKYYKHIEKMEYGSQLVRSYPVIAEAAFKDLKPSNDNKTD